MKTYVKWIVILAMTAVSLMQESLADGLGMPSHPGKGSRAISTPLLGGEFSDLSTSAAALILTSTSFCSGVLVGASHVLTAGHCTDSAAADYLVVVGYDSRAVTHVHTHPNYDPHGSTNFSNSRYDLGILELSDPITSVRPFAVLYDDPVHSGEVATVFGFGTNELPLLVDDKLSIHGKTGSVVVEFVGAGMISTFSNFSDASVCSGDSGGPLVKVSHDGRFAAVVGITSTGTNQTDDNGICSLGSNGRSNFVDLQAISSKDFLGSFSGVQYLSGKRVSLLLSGEKLQDSLTTLLGLRRLAALKSGARKQAQYAKTLFAYTNDEQALALSRVVKGLSSASRARTSALAKKAINKSLTDILLLLEPI